MIPKELDHTQKRAYVVRPNRRFGAYNQHVPGDEVLLTDLEASGVMDKVILKPVPLTTEETAALEKEAAAEAAEAAALKSAKEKEAAAEAAEAAALIEAAKAEEAAKATKSKAKK